LSPLVAQYGVFLLTLVFAAGGAWFALKESVRHVNGLGAKLNSVERDRQEREERFQLALMSLATEEQKAIVVQCLTGEQK